MNRNEYNAEQAVQFILEPGDESELSDLDEDDDHDEISARLHVITIELKSKMTLREMIDARNKSMTITKEILPKKKFKTVL